MKRVFVGIVIMICSIAAYVVAQGAETRLFAS
jgi:hypothetical protein